MKKLLFISLLLLVASSLVARKRTAAEYVNTGNALLDSIIIGVNARVDSFIDNGIGKIDVLVDIDAYSFSENHRWWTPFCHDMIPFDARPNKMTRLSATCKASYQSPCDMLVTPLTYSSDHRRRSMRILKELNQVLIPIYDIRLMRDKGDDKEFIVPFSFEGLKRYNYELADSTSQRQDSIITIKFQPKNPHHNLLEGEADVNLSQNIPQEFRLQGNIDFGKMKDTIRFAIVRDVWIPQQSSVLLEYQYGKLQGYNHFDYRFNFKQVLSRTALDTIETSLDLSEVYQTQPSDFINTSEATTQQTDTIEQQTSKSRRFFKKLPQRIVSSSNFEAFGSDIRVYGPLNPAFIGYDKINGVTVRQRMRFQHLFGNGQSIKITPEVGFAFRPKDFRYRFNAEWTYNPKRRASLTLRLQNGSTGFSSRFKKDIDRILNQYNNELQLIPLTALNHRHFKNNNLSFDSLGLQYFERYEFLLENSIELATGLRFYLGVDYSIRRPVKHGVHASVEKVTNKAIDKRYLDMNPYLRLVWTPRQYYYIDNNQKLYLKSHWPTFSFEVGKGVKNVLKSRANYCRIELDAHQHIPIGNSRNLSWHCGAGGFIKQDEEYFVNYTYFSRSQYPSSWDRRTIGGTFALLDDYWYSSSPSYTQAHVMYESPFLLLHNWRFISKYVIKERIYGSSLWAQGKNPYCELGYGIGNNYFNASVFCGLMGNRPFDIGVKFSFELDKHL